MNFTFRELRQKNGKEPVGVGVHVTRNPPFLKPNNEHQAIAHRNYNQKREHAARDTASDEVLNSQVSLACL